MKSPEAEISFCGLFGACNVGGGREGSVVLGDVWSAAVAGTGAAAGVAAGAGAGAGADGWAGAAGVEEGVLAVRVE